MKPLSQWLFGTLILGIRDKEAVVPCKSSGSRTLSHLINTKMAVVLLLLLITNSFVHAEQGPRVYLDLSKPKVAHLRHFWKSTGLCPPAPHSQAHKFLLHQDEKVNLALIGALPRRAIIQVRIHWLFDLVTINRSGIGETSFNFTYLDQLMDWMYHWRLRPGFELMGNPSGIFNDFLNDTQVDLWKCLVSDTAARYIGRYGPEAVSEWLFETWNEPDLRSYNTLNFTLESYLRYFKASSDGLKQSSVRLKLGGPAGLFKAPSKHPLCWGLLRHCAENFSCNLDFISFHKKGGGSGAAILQQDIEMAESIAEMFPVFQNTPLVNDEADPLTGWSKSEEWRGDVRYAALVTSVIISHQREMVRHRALPLYLLSNDNAFLNYHPFYFTQRTLLARFQVNNTHPPHVQFFLKPVYVTMAMLSYLGDEELDVKVRNPDPRLNVVATRNTTAQDISLLLVWNNDTQNDNTSVVTVKLRVVHCFQQQPRYVLYRLDNVLTNPYSVWRNAGSPVYPDKGLRALMRAVEGPARTKGPKTVQNRGRLRLSVPMMVPSVILLHICPYSNLTPGQASGLTVFNVTYNEVLVIWKDAAVSSSCIKTYEVEFKDTSRTSFRRINNEDIILLSFHFAPQPAEDSPTMEMTSGLYRVRAVDYWNRAGPYSAVVAYPDQ